MRWLTTLHYGRTAVTADSGPLVKTLRQHCLSMPGGKLDDLGDYSVLDGDLKQYATFEVNESPPFLLFRCRDSVRNKLGAKAVRVSKRMNWDTEGWNWCETDLDGPLPLETLRSLIDDSYQLVLEDLDDDQRFEIELITRGLSPEGTLAELIRFHKFTKRRQEIESLLRPSLRLTTHDAKHSKLKRGQSRIGGFPDLPESVTWPLHRSGKPLAFLAQINFSDIPPGSRLPDFPSQGMLYFFSVYGWMGEDEVEPDLPSGKPAPDWTQILYTPDASTSGLKPTKPPAEVNSFPIASVEFHGLPSLPTDTREPVFGEQKWSGEAKEKYNSLQETFSAAITQKLGNPPKHQLGGFADYEQEFVKAVAKEKLQLLFHLASDFNMSCGDDGYLYFWIKPEDLRRCDFSQVLVDYQCG